MTDWANRAATWAAAADWAADPPPPAASVDYGALPDLETRLVEANVNPETYLATDYLNHFNQITMVLDLSAADRSLLDEAGDWAPKSYHQHFYDSGFKETALINWAFDHAPLSVRELFDPAVVTLDHYIEEALWEARNPACPADIIADRVALINAQIGLLYAIINGRKAMAQDAVDGNFDAGSASQDDIDSLFD
ncbi:hypothetical protein EV659_101302 [Rhodothalassium salexigens DSM 2132]|uniref:Uncharacterized protein n=1 Tax=Rhodothalassium salexigens DSM 2132 TaxID=1188247 RepID=A0A4R2PTP7_RHOSA|nr:hypothetical protein [Rhodothalassium salexigens]MBB4210234.1 hypothetical protein [Rhodothalassium salexigens DSM 2132]MBK1638674.1 hypothetical protein [Rhodothalassium salexigens DSM 2132]TCP38398.1 hypothetical protein EV659_101302 [Rhodothalassium salexigens DSM 2132]